MSVVTVSGERVGELELPRGRPFSNDWLDDQTVLVATQISGAVESRVTLLHADLHPGIPCLSD